ncbi:MAG: SMC family ATPase [Anaerolineales bacterium]|nr:SMC family ATPase [Anaerolineales bacterium]
MIPVYLSITGFLSYRDPVEIDFTSFDLACIAGPNGAGKSSLLDAITWALFGQARKRDDSVINSLSSAAEVSLIFAYEGNYYRVQRAKPRDKTSMLEFHILQVKDPGDQEPASALFTARDSQLWKPLTERTLRDTEARIESTLRMDYETFINASFFLQGKADQFTQQRSGDRKRILGSILGLEVWEEYRKRAAERRRRVEAEISSLDGRLHEIAVELSEEGARIGRLKELQADLERLEKERKGQDTLVKSARQIAATLAEQEKLVEALSRQAQAAALRLEGMRSRLAERSEERDSQASILQRAGEIESAYAAWQAARAELERWEQIAEQFREHEKRREGPRAEIQEARARLEQERFTLRQQETESDVLREQSAAMQPDIESVNAALAQAEESLARKQQLEDELQSARQRQAEARAENPRLKAEMDELKARIDQLIQTDGAACPLCGQPLEPQERQALVERLNAQGAEMGDRYRANQALLKQADENVAGLEAQIAELALAEPEARAHGQRLAELNSRLEALQGRQAEWVGKGKPRLEEIDLALENESYAPQARAQLAQIDAELKQIGYDAAAHDAVRQAELVGRASEIEQRALEQARATLAPLEREIADLHAQIGEQESEAAHLQEQAQVAAQSLATAREAAPDLLQAEQVLFDLQERENRLRIEMGAALQQVEVLDDLKARKLELEAQREDLAVQAGRYRQLERAFGKDGVPALLIEQALPEIETRANEVLARLSAGAMSVRFVTQAEYKDKHREDLKETLDIQISDNAGRRDYEMFSGGEAFRVNFAIRLALSEVLAQRAGARLQTLVIDEGFGSQDALGRQRLIEAINLVRADFAKILVITHIDELKDAFPNRIEVEKTERGSVVTVI